MYIIFVFTVTHLRTCIYGRYAPTMTCCTTNAFPLRNLSIEIVPYTKDLKSSDFECNLIENSGLIQLYISVLDKSNQPRFCWTNWVQQQCRTWQSCHFFSVQFNIHCTVSIQQTGLIKNQCSKGVFPQRKLTTTVNHICDALTDRKCPFILASFKQLPV